MAYYDSLYSHDDDDVVGVYVAVYVYVGIFVIQERRTWSLPSLTSLLLKQRLYANV